MQTLDVISVNLWQILASLLNLLLMFLIVKRFLYRPVRKMLDRRRATIDRDYSEASRAKEEALADRAAYRERLDGAAAEAESVIRAAVETASRREKDLLDEAKKKAEGILKQAETDADLERRKAQETIKDEIVVVSSLLTEKLLEREVKTEDHKQLIDRFLADLNEDSDGTN